jgi:hypothetical protein
MIQTLRVILDASNRSKHMLELVRRPAAFAVHKAAAFARIRSRRPARNAPDVVT